MGVLDINHPSLSKLGPKGLGDPDDKSLRKVEVEIKIPQKMRDKAKATKCADYVKDFNDCAIENGIMLVFKCRKENNLMKDCLSKWFHDKDFFEECKQEYLSDRSEYRRTGISRTPYSRAHN